MRCTKGMTFDNIEAKLVARLGWFERFHNELHGHQDFRQYIDSKLMRDNVTLDYEIFTQYVWNGPPAMRNIINALILDIDTQQWDKAINFMLNLAFDQRYSKVIFWPLIQ